MQELTVIGIEEGSLLLAAAAGEQFTLAIDDQLHARLRERNLPSAQQRKVSPREIQAHIRAGLSAEEVAAVTGVDLEHVQRYEGPVLAERSYVIESALAVPVHTAGDLDPLGLGPDFGTVIRERLSALGAISVSWSTWKQHTSEWTIGLAFQADSVDHDARWQFDAKRHTLSPINAEARSLSQQEQLDAPLIPRLRAVPQTERATDDSRFDSGAFVFDMDLSETGPAAESAPRGRRSENQDAAQLAAIKRAEPEGEAHSEQTEDLLEALRRRRGEREAAAFADVLDLPELERASITLIDIPVHDHGSGEGHASASVHREQASTKPQTSVKASRNGRAAMPSWDEIVFGTRTDED